MIKMDDQTRKAINKALRVGLQPLRVDEPLNLVEWAEQHFYLSAESSYVEQRWEAIPWQRGIMHAISNDDIKVVNWIKSARVGATKIMLAASFYFAHHKKRNQIFYQPTDGDAEEFCKTEVDTALRDVHCMKEVFPDLGKQNKNNTTDMKQFVGSSLKIKGGNTGRNYRRISSDVNFYDELEAFKKDIDGEGSPLKLGDKRLEGSLYGKSVRMTTPKIKHDSIIEAEVHKSDVYMTYEVPCPHCGQHQVLRWGGKDADHGFKWDGDDPRSVYYLCEHNGCVIHNNDLTHMNDHGYWRDSKRGIKLMHDGYFEDDFGAPVDPPKNVSFHIWTAYSPFVQWSTLVGEYLGAMRTLKRDSDVTELKTFINTTLGETWEDAESERMDSEVLYNRREHYPPEGFPERGLYIVAGLDMQDDRIEGKVKAYGLHNESWTLDYFVLRGNPAMPELWDICADRLHKTYIREDGAEMSIGRVTFDSGGHFTSEVYEFSKRMGINFVIPTKGASVYGEPLVSFPRKRNKDGVLLTMIGTDTAKDIIYKRLEISSDDPTEATAGMMHFPIAPFCDRNYFEQLTSEEKVRKKHRGKWVLVYDNKDRRNESLDCEVGCLAALAISQQHYGVNLEQLNFKKESPQLRDTIDNDFLSAADALRLD